MISTVIFSLVLLMCLVGIVQVSRTYYKGVTRAKTQETTRRLMDEIKESIQLSGVKIQPTSGPAGPQVLTSDNAQGTLCVGNKLYSYAIDRMNTGSVNSDPSKKEIKNALLSDDTLCAAGISPQDLNSPAALSSTQKSLLDNNMRLTKFEVNEVSSGSGLWKVEISIAYGAQDLLRYTDDTGAGRVVCANNTGAEFCSIAELSTIVTRRISNATN